jgi:1-acyl-sn-glycerol-3-phosphate acyltransferase
LTEVGAALVVFVVAATGLVTLTALVLRRLEQRRRADWGGRWLNRLDALNRLLCRYVHGLRHAPLTLPRTGPALVVSNHVSGLDPLLLIAAADRPLRFVIAREQYERWYLKWLFAAVGCIPVERSRNPRAAFRAARAALARGEVVALFPHGAIHLDHHPRRPLKRGVAVLAAQSAAPVYPVRIDGVRGQGLTVAAVAVPSRVRLTCFEPLYFGDEGAQALLAELERLLTRPS